MRFHRRLRLLYIVFCLALGVVWLRATQLQVLDGDAWAAAARKMRQRREPLEARRGRILSADGVVLAEDRPVFQLAVVAWNWQRRHRARCRDCGTIYFQRGKRGRFPKRCSCDRYRKRGSAGEALASDPYPRAAADEPAGNLETLPDGDVSALERDLGLEKGEIARRAQRRIDKIEGIVAKARKRWERDGDNSMFRDERLELMEQDLLMRPYVILPRVPDSVARRVLTDETGQYRGLRIEAALRRYYPQGDLAPHLLGWTSELRDYDEYERLCKEQGEDRITLSTRVGRRGLERAYNWQLHGIPGYRVMELGDDGSFSEVVEEVAPRRGRDLRLGIDVGVSRAAERILEDYGRRNDGYLPGGKPSGAFVALDAKTGEILIWAEMPRFDLNHLDELFDRDRPEPVADLVNRVWRTRTPLEPPLDLQTWRDELVMPVPVTYSRVAQIPVEPGSTMKPLMALAMLSSGHPPLAAYLCGSDNGKPHCHHHGLVDLVAAITRSCNPYFAHSLRDTDAWPIYRRYVGGFIDSLGLGHKPGSEIREWAPGQWLWPWVDFDLKTAVGHARKALQQDLHDNAPALELVIRPRTPATVGGDAARLGRTLASVAAYVARHSGAKKVVIAVGKEADDGRKVVLRFGLRAAGVPGWFALPGARVTEPLPGVLQGLGAHRAGVVGDVERGGTVWFTAPFERHTGRTDPTQPPIIRPDDAYNVAIGQGPVLVTPLQMARAMALIANGGTLVEPHAVDSLDGKKLGFPSRHLTLDPAHLRLVRDGMYGVANEPPGTADHCGFIDLPATVYGKTGTAQLGQSWKPFDTAESNPAWHEWFVGFSEGPGRTLAFACVLHARTEAAAGKTSAWVAKEVLQKWYASSASRGRGH